MSERRLFVPGERLGGPRLTLTGPEHRHVGRVLRARPGDALTLFDGAGGEVEAKVVRVERAETELALGARRAVAGPAVSLTLLCAVPRGPRMDLLVQKTSELGVARIVPVVTERSVARPDAEAGQAGALGEDRPRGGAAVRAGRPPDRRSAGRAGGGAGGSRSSRLGGWRCSRVSSARSLRAALAGTEPAATALLVGPEGGFAPAELAVARAAGFEAVGLGDRILRVETAAIVAVALVAGAYGMLG